MSTDVDLLHAGPGRHAVDLEHGRPLVGVVEDIDTGEIRADRGGGAHRECFHVGIRRRPSTGRPPRLTLVIQVGAVAHHGGDDAAARHQQTEIAKAVALDADEALQIIDPGDAARLGQLALGVRISRSPRPCEPNSGLSTSGPRAGLARDDRARRGRRFAPPRSSGVGMPARASRKLVIDLSTQRSIARASFHTMTPSSRSACSMPSRIVTASKLPPDIVRTQHGVGQPASKPRGSQSPDALRVSKPHASQPASRPSPRPDARKRFGQFAGMPVACGRPRCRRGGAARRPRRARITPKEASSRSELTSPRGSFRRSRSP